MGLDLTDPGFDFSVLSEFRSRLVESAKESLLLQKLIEGCKERGYLRVRGRQRTDSTHVLGSLRLLSKPLSQLGVGNAEVLSRPTF